MPVLTPRRPTPSPNHRAVTSSLNPNWRTPAWLYTALAGEFAFTLDAAADADSHKAPVWLGPGSPLSDNALGVSWADVTDGAIFCNPPYSAALRQPIAPWFAKMAEAGHRRAVVGVVPYAPQTRHWRTYVVGEGAACAGRATEIRLFRHRIKFDPPPGYVGDAPGANVNTAVVIWRPSVYFPDPWVPQQRYWAPPMTATARGG